jgi:hypothetical protein
MTRCAQCDGKFGLTRHRWYNVAFCSKHCREKYLDKLARDRAWLKEWFNTNSKAASDRRAGQ